MKHNGTAPAAAAHHSGGQRARGLAEEHARAAPGPLLGRAGERLISMGATLWSAVQVGAPTGQVFEIDGLILDRHGLHVVETRSWSGRITTDGKGWHVESSGERVPVDSPLLAGAHKARLLVRLLKQELGAAWVPVTPLVVLTHPDAEIAISGADRVHVLQQEDLRHLVEKGGALPETGAPRPRLDPETIAAVREVIDRLVRGQARLREELLPGVRALVRQLRTGARLPRIHAAVWVISCGFVRAIEERGLLEGSPLTTGWTAAAARDVSADGEGAATAHLRAILRRVAAHPAGAAVLEEQSPLLWDTPLPEVAAEMLLQFFGERDALGEPRWSFTGDPWIALYQDVFAAKGEEEAMLATPPIVADVLLDKGLEPALCEYGPDATRVLDPACGSGLLLEKAFLRLFARLQRDVSGRQRRNTASQALDLIHGADNSPIAVLLTRIRLVLAYLNLAGVSRLAEARRPPLHIVLADSLLAGKDESATTPANEPIFRRRYQVVVSEPPFSLCRDSRRRALYRALYPRSAVARFSLLALFVERCFELAERNGFVGIMATRSFAQRMFGKRLVEQFLSRIDITHLVDAHAAPLPGRLVPTLLLFGRNRPPESGSVRAVLGKRVEPGISVGSTDVWVSMRAHLDHPGHEDAHVSVADVPRATLATHPWPLIGPATRDDYSRAELVDAFPGELARTLEETLAQAFREAGWLVWSAERQSAHDLLVHKGAHLYAVELKAVSDTRPSRLLQSFGDAILRARRGAASIPGAQPLTVIGATAMSEASAAELRAYAWTFAEDDAYGWIDTEGRLSLHGPGLSAMQHAKGHGPAVAARRASSFDPFSDPCQWALKVLLAPQLQEEWLSAPREQIRSAAHLGEVASVSSRNVLRLCNYLRAEGFLPSMGPLKVARTGELLARWRDALRRDVPVERPMCFRGKGTPARQRFDEALRAYAAGPMREGAPRVCVGLFAAADRLGFPFVHGVAQHLYVERFSADALAQLDLTPAPAGRAADVLVRGPARAESIFRGAVLRDGVPVADILQTWLDTSVHPARGEEQAEYLLRKALRPRLSMVNRDD